MYCRRKSRSASKSLPGPHLQPVLIHRDPHGGWTAYTKLDPAHPLDKNSTFSPADEAKVSRRPPRSRSRSALKKDHEYLLKGDVFTEDVIEKWIGYKTANEVDAIRLRPHP